MHRNLARNIEDEAIYIFIGIKQFDTWLTDTACVTLYKKHSIAQRKTGKMQFLDAVSTYFLQNFSFHIIHSWSTQHTHTHNIFLIDWCLVWFEYPVLCNEINVCHFVVDKRLWKSQLKFISDLDDTPIEFDSLGYILPMSWFTQLNRLKVHT